MISLKFIGRKVRIGFFAMLATSLLPALQQQALGQYKVFNLDSNRTGQAMHTDPNMGNSWGIAYGPTTPFAVANAFTGLITVYNGIGVPVPFTITVPPASGIGKGHPTGIVFNSTTDFKITKNGKTLPAQFIMDGEDGTISGWNLNVDRNNAVIVVNNSGSHSDYTGVAIGQNNGSNFIYAADNVNNRVDIFDASFNFVKSFTDPNVPAGQAPYNVQNINGQLYVIYGKFGMAGGVVDIFDMAGNLVKTLTSGGNLSAPWGVAMAPSNFGQFSGDLLVANLGDGKINAFDHSSGAFIGTLSSNNQPIVINGLWAIYFGGGGASNGKTNQLFFAAGPGGYRDGLFGGIIAQ
jgi:uncharacterized protein (TIGR03118 family)